MNALKHLYGPGVWVLMLAMFASWGMGFVLAQSHFEDATTTAEQQYSPVELAFIEPAVTGRDLSRLRTGDCLRASTPAMRMVEYKRKARSAIKQLKV